MSAVDPLELRDKGKNKALDAWAEMQAIHAERRANQQQGQNSTSGQTKSEEKITDVQVDGFNRAQTNAIATGVSNASNSDGSREDSSGQNTGRNQHDSVVRTIANASRSEMPTNVVSFFNDGAKPETQEARYDLHQRVSMANAINRSANNTPGAQQLGNETLEVIRNMDADDVASGLNALRQGPGKPPATNMPNQGDSFGD